MASSREPSLTEALLNPITETEPLFSPSLVSQVSDRPLSDSSLTISSQSSVTSSLISQSDKSEVGSDASLLLVRALSAPPRVSQLTKSKQSSSMRRPQSEPKNMRELPKIYGDFSPSPKDGDFSPIEEDFPPNPQLVSLRKDNNHLPECNQEPPQKKSTWKKYIASSLPWISSTTFACLTWTGIINSAKYISHFEGPANIDDLVNNGLMETPLYVIIVATAAAIWSYRSNVWQGLDFYDQMEITINKQFKPLFEKLNNPNIKLTPKEKTLLLSNSILIIAAATASVIAYGSTGFLYGFGILNSLATFIITFLTRGPGLFKWINNWDLFYTKDEVEAKHLLEALSELQLKRQRKNLIHSNEKSLPIPSDDKVIIEIRTKLKKIYAKYGWDLPDNTEEMNAILQDYSKQLSIQRRCAYRLQTMSHYTYMGGAVSVGWGDYMLKFAGLMGKLPIHPKGTAKIAWDCTRVIISTIGTLPHGLFFLWGSREVFSKTYYSFKKDPVKTTVDILTTSLTCFGLFQVTQSNLKEPPVGKEILPRADSRLGIAISFIGFLNAGHVNIISTFNKTTLNSKLDNQLLAENSYYLVLQDVLNQEPTLEVDGEQTYLPLPESPEAKKSRPIQIDDHSTEEKSDIILFMPENVEKLSIQHSSSLFKSPTSPDESLRQPLLEEEKLSDRTVHDIVPIAKNKGRESNIQHSSLFKPSSPLSGEPQKNSKPSISENDNQNEQRGCFDRIRRWCGRRSTG